MGRPGPNDPCWCGSGRKYKKCHQARDLVADLGGASARPVIASPGDPRAVRSGTITPRRTVPPAIPRPDYAVSGRPGGSRIKNLIKTPEQIERMRRACRAAREVLDEVTAAVRPGITTDALDVIAHEGYIKRGGFPSTLNYHGYPKSICTSVNEVICHGIPDSRPLGDGDIVNVDVTIFLDGMHGDLSETVLVGEVDAESRALVATTLECLMRGIGAVKPGGLLRDVGRAIQDHAEAHGYGVVRAFVGHGIGEVFHMDPQVPHYHDPALTTRLQPGTTFTIEPMINQGRWEHRLWNDKWTAVTIDGRRSAQFEHTVLVTERGVEVLTLRDGEAQPFAY
ncbi:MAG: type I methionyl aminopeptidase [Planctomycetes bacterium]|nr:type I methionyl aminopeptidase [Planctomycetota bacterium]